MAGAQLRTGGDSHRVTGYLGAKLWVGVRLGRAVVPPGRGKCKSAHSPPASGGLGPGGAWAWGGDSGVGASPYPMPLPDPFRRLAHPSLPPVWDPQEQVGTLRWAGAPERGRVRPAGMGVTGRRWSGQAWHCPPNFLFWILPIFPQLLLRRRCQL